MKNLSGFVSDDRLCYAPLADLGWEVVEVPWENEGTDWGQFASVLIRTPWNYQDHPEQFMARLAEIEASGILLENPLPLVRWNYRKTYLRDLREKGVSIVPTVWREAGELRGLDVFFDEFSCQELIVKPVVGANADHTFRLGRAQLPELQNRLKESFAGRAFMIQPFLPAVLAEGEFSVFYFGGQMSHAIVKIPKPGDFRVQEEHGGLICAIHAGQALRDAADQVFANITPVPLYGRVDLVRDPAGRFRLMELELIEPSLYLRMHPDAPKNFAEALDRWISADRKK